MFLSSSSTSSADEGEATATSSQDLEYETVTRLRLKTKSSPLSTDVKRKVKNSTKKEESLFSLKQFLKNDNHTNHQFTGARPKVYEPQLRTSKSNENNETGNYPRNPTELPDFVQDHLVIEQCYLSDKVSTNTGNLEADNLPDFALNSVKKKHTQNLNGQWNNASTDITFDLTDNLHKDSAINSSLQNCLHLPKLDVIDGESADIPECLGFPFDIQISRGAESNSNSSKTINNSISHEIHDTSKLLPDFLSEAPIRSRGIPLSDRPKCSRSSDSINQWFKLMKMIENRQSIKEDASESGYTYSNVQRREYFVKLEKWLLEAYAWHSFVATVPYILASSPILHDTNFNINNQQRDENSLNERRINEPAATQIQISGVTGITYRIPPIWKRYVAELIDSILLFVLKMSITFIAVDVFNIIDIERYYSDMLQTNLRIDYKLALELTSGLLILELIHRIFVCAFETSWLQHGRNGRIGGATPGKSIMRLKVVQCRSVSPVGLPDEELVSVVPGTDLGLLPALGRSALKNVILAFFFPICFSMCFFRFNRTGYDLVCNSIVVEDVNINRNNNLNNNIINNNNNFNNNNNHRIYE